MSKGEHDSGMRILLFEDTEDTRQRIVNDFTTQLRSNVTECAKAGQVLDLLKQQSTAFDFVVIDYKMEYAEGNIRTGLDLVERIVKSQELQILIPIILYTLREDTPSVVYRRSRHLGVQYVHQLELTGLLNDLKKRLQVLKAIKTRLEKMLAQKRLMGHVLGELDVGFQIVDLDCKIHYQDDKYKRLMGESGSKGNVCFCTVHGYPLAHDRCFNCLMRKGVPETKKSPETVAHGYEESTYYSPIYPDGPGSRPVYEYIEVRTFPVCVGGACKSGAKPDAVIETVRIVPAGTCIASKPRCDHLDILRRAFLDFGYREARIYEYIEGDKTLVPACVGDDNRVAIALQSTPDVVDGAREDLLSFEISDVSCLKTPRLVLDSGIQQFLIGLRDARGRFVGVVALGHDRKEKDDYAWIDRDRWREEDRDSSNAASVKQKDGKGESAETVKVIGPSSLSIASEVSRVLCSKKAVAKTNESPSSDSTSDILHRIHGRLVERIAVTTEEDLSVEPLLSAICEFVPDIKGIHCRRIEGHEAVLWKGIGEYFEVASKREPVKNTAWVAEAVIERAKPEYSNRVSEADLVKYPLEKREIVRQFRSHGTWPLDVAGEVIGIVVFMAEPEGFFSPDHRYLCDRLARLLALCLFDDIVDKKRDADARLQAWQTLSGRSSHKIGNLLTAADGALRRASRMNPDGGNSALSDLKFDLLGIRRVMDEYRMFAVNEPCIPVQTDVRALLERAVRQYRCIRDGAEIDLVMPEAPLHWNIDAERMAEVICQLLDNGLAFSDHLTVAAQKYARVLKIVVTDQGPGVESYLKERIFEPFFSSRSGGSGLGLAIVRQIVENHGGSIVECGQPEQGACFMIELPETKEKQP